MFQCGGWTGAELDGAGARGRIFLWTRSQTTPIAPSTREGSTQSPRCSRSCSMHGRHQSPDGQSASFMHDAVH